MIRSTKSPQLAFAAALSAMLILGNVATVSAAVPPEQSSGMTGRAKFRESSMIPAPICVYTEPEFGVSTIANFRVRAPKVWWPAGAPGDHGRVGWRVRVQDANDASGPWLTVSATGVQMRTAWDDASADFANRTIPGEGRLSDVVYRLVSQIYWYDAEGNVIGWVKHWYRWYGRSIETAPPPGWSSPPDQVRYGKCKNRWFM